MCNVIYMFGTKIKFNILTGRASVVNTTVLGDLGKTSDFPEKNAFSKYLWCQSQMKIYL